MTETDPQGIVAAVVMADAAERVLIRDVLRAAGIDRVHDCASTSDLRGMIAAAPVDLLVMGADMDGGFAAVRDMRHGRVGANPFVHVMTVIAPERNADLVAAVAAGTDEVLSRPLKEAPLVARLRRGGGPRAPFVAASDYIGPDRRAKERADFLPRLAVPNVVADKFAGRGAQIAGYTRDFTSELMRLRLAAHGYRLGMLCRLVGEGDPEPFRAQVVSILLDAASLSARLGEPEMDLLCRVMAARRGTLDGALAAQIAEGLVPALQPGLSADEHRRAATRAAAVYRERPREAGDDLLIFGGDASGPAHDVPEITVMAVNKKQTLFRQGTPATAAHVVTSGTLALYREDDGTTRVLSKAVRGEILGELAAADGEIHQASAIALEDSTVAVLPATLFSRPGHDADPVLGGLLQTLHHSLRMAHELYGPRSRHIADSVLEMRAQVAAILGYLQSPSASAELKAEAEAVAARLGQLTGELVTLVGQHPELDRRARAVPEGIQVTEAKLPY